MRNLSYKSFLWLLAFVFSQRPISADVFLTNIKTKTMENTDVTNVQSPDIFGILAEKIRKKSCFFSDIYRFREEISKNKVKITYLPHVFISPFSNCKGSSYFKLKVFLRHWKQKWIFLYVTKSGVTNGHSDRSSQW